MGEAKLNRNRRPMVVQAYVEAAKEILPTVFEPACCLNGTRVCIEALKLHRVNARPMVVDMIAANATANRMFEESGGWPKTDDDVKRWLADGAWVLMVDGKSDGVTPSLLPSGWNHHLVADVGDLIVDSSLGQASRPGKSIELPWCAAFPRGGFGITRDTIVYDAPEGATIGFRHRPDVTSYVNALGFQRSRHNMEAAVAVAKKMHLILAEEQHAATV